MFPPQAIGFIRLKYLTLAGNILSILLKRNAIAGSFMNTNLLVLMEFLQQSIRLNTQPLLWCIFNKRISYRKSYSHPLPPISIEELVVDDDFKPPVLLQSESAKEHGKERRPGVVTALIGNRRSCRGQPVSNRRGGRARDWLAEGVNRELEVDSDKEEDQGTEIEDEDEDEDNDKEIEQEEEDQVVEEEDSELSDMTYSVIEVLESEVIPEVMPRVVSGRTTRSGRALQWLQ
jgi:hypothetical protein